MDLVYEAKAMTFFLKAKAKAKAKDMKIFEGQHQNPLKPIIIYELKFA